MTIDQMLRPRRNNSTSKVNDKKTQLTKKPNASANSTPKPGTSQEELNLSANLPSTPSPIKNSSDKIVLSVSKVPMANENLSSSPPFGGFHTVKKSSSHDSIVPSNTDIL